MNSISKHSVRMLLLSLFITVATYGQVTLPKLISDGMVLQRDAELTIWGWAGIDERISVTFLDSTYHTAADDSGKWNITLPHQHPGGPYTMHIEGHNTITVNDILIGDVWVCSGQSNMELPMYRVRPLYEAEIHSAYYPSIRYFNVPQRYNFNEPQEDFDTGRWQHINPDNVRNFSAVAYFFGKKLYETYGVPIGLLHTSLGGSPAEAWMSEEALRYFPHYYDEAQQFKDTTLIERIEHGDNARIQNWYERLRQKDKGYENSGEIWYDPETSLSGWGVMHIPGTWADTELGPVNGVVWFRKDIDLAPDQSGQPGKLELGAIIDADSVYVNGIFIGTTGYRYPPRWYEIPEGILTEGKNTIVVRVINEGGNGGFVPDKPYELVVGEYKINLEGEWYYRLGAEMEPLESRTFIRWKPLGLFNAMIAPLLNYRIQGVIWYQGESNTGRPIEYRELFPAMIEDWRRHWSQGDFPFLFVQLANYMEPDPEPSESNWALLREAQLAALSVPNTGMAVTIDIGEWNDIHPLNKKDVGERLARAARKVAYGDDLVHSGPLYRSVEVKGDTAVISFDNVGSGLCVKGGDSLRHFAIAGSDREFVRARAIIRDNKVIVWNDTVSNPVAVRYAWADNPGGANLFNREGLPASPFRTDGWSVEP
jgi:sialate O-acetylesterase